MKIIGILTFIVFLSSCATAQPNFLNGNYYMSGDDDCVSARQVRDKTIMCFDSSDRPTGHRTAMTDQQLRMYMHQKEIDRADSAAAAAIMLNSSKKSRQTDCLALGMGDLVSLDCR